MSLSKLRKITEEGVIFNSHIDGSKHMLTPERALRYNIFLIVLLLWRLMNVPHILQHLSKQNHLWN